MACGWVKYGWVGGGSDETDQSSIGAGTAMQKSKKKAKCARQTNQSTNRPTKIVALKEHVFDFFSSFFSFLMPEAGRREIWGTSRVGPRAMQIQS